MGHFKKGQTFHNQYTIIEHLGEGGMGDVYLAEDSKLSRKVAIKTFKHESEQESTQKKRFLNEAKILASLNHPNIVSVHNLFEDQGHHYIVMEYLQGDNLSTVSKSRSFGLKEILKVISSLTDALHEAHSKGVLHRDIKLSNIVFDTKGNPKLVDFGISKSLLDDNNHFTKTDHFIGTLQYLAPEIVKGQNPSPQSDIYSLGIVFYEMLCGHNPFVSTNKLKTLEKIKTFDIEIPTEIQALLPAGVEKILRKMLAKKPDQRFTSCLELLNSLKSLSFEDFDETLLMSMRPEVMIVNESTLRMKLIGSGYKTREVGIILSLAAQYQEQLLPVDPDRTVVTGEEDKVMITEAALEQARKRFEKSKKQCADSKTHSFSNFQKLDASDYNKLLGAGVAFALLAVVFWGVLKFDSSRVNEANANMLPPAEMTLNPPGTVAIQLRKKISVDYGNVLIDSKVTYRYLASTPGYKKATIDYPNENFTLDYESPANFIVPATKLNISNGWSENSVLSGNFNSIFPLEVGKVAQFSHTKIRGRENVERRDNECQVTNQETMTAPIGTYLTYKIVCVALENKEVKEKKVFYYSPELKEVIKNEIETTEMNQGKPERFMWSMDLVSLTRPGEETIGK